MLLICIPRVEQNTLDSVFSTVEAVRVSLKAENGEEEALAGGLACPRISCAGRWAGGLAPRGAPAACPGTAGAWGAEPGVLPAAVRLVLPVGRLRWGRQRVPSPPGENRPVVGLVAGSGRGMARVAGLSLRTWLAANQRRGFSSGKQKKTVASPKFPVTCKGACVLAGVGALPASDAAQSLIVFPAF